MKETNHITPSAHRVMAATDRSETADSAVRWAADLAAGFQAELLLFQVLVPGNLEETGPDVMEVICNRARQELMRFSEELAGSRGRAKVVIDADPAAAILEAIEAETVDVIVLGNVGMSGRKQFLLGNVSNRISHNARCTVIIVNTANLDRQAETSRPSRTRPRDSTAATVLEGQLLGRATRIGRVLLKAGVSELLKKPRATDEAAMRAGVHRFRASLEELGPTFAKLGQILSTRPDLLPPVYIEELATLQERVTPLAEAEVVSVMEEELGIPWEDVFESIDPQPLAAGTIAQVHRATLESGERVVVKVQRPTAEADIIQDLALLEMFVQKIAHRPVFRQVFDLPAMVSHLSDSLRRELDFRQEANNIERMREVLSRYARLDVPKVYKEYSTSRLLVMEEVQGIPVLQAPSGRARTEAAHQLLESYYSQVMIEGFFHADPHPGNMKWWNDKIYLLDLGMVGEVEPEVRELILLLLLAFAQKDASFLSEVVLMLAGKEQDRVEIDFEAFQEELGHLVTKYRDLPLKEIQIGPILQELSEVSFRHNVPIPASLALAGKAFSQMQLVAAELDPTLDPFSFAESFVLRNTIRQLTDGLDLKQLFYQVQKAKFRVVRFFETIEGITSARPGAKLQVNFRGTERLEHTIAKASRLLSLALVLSGTAVGTAVTAVSPQVPWWVPAAIGSAGVVLSVLLVADLIRRSR
jgi:ubiquinone biosynthesis protein